jgi:hypothetical protein
VKKKSTWFILKNQMNGSKKIRINSKTPEYCELECSSRVSGQLIKLSSWPMTVVGFRLEPHREDLGLDESNYASTSFLENSRELHEDKT